MTNEAFLNKNEIYLEIIHLSSNQCCRYFYPSLFDCFEWYAMLWFYKEVLTLIIDVYDGINVSITLKLIRIKLYMNDIIKLGRSKYKLKTRKQMLSILSNRIFFEGCILLVTYELIIPRTVET